MAQNNTAYSFPLFEPYDYGTEVPQYEPEMPVRREPDVKPHKKKEVKKPAHKVKTKAEVHAETIASLKMMSKAIIVVAFIFTIISAVLYLNVKLDETADRISNVQHEIDMANAENVRLNSLLESMVAINKVEQYATSVLGMVKVENYKITYFEGDNQNKVVVSGGKSYDEDVNFVTKIKDFISYIVT